MADEVSMTAMEYVLGTLAPDERAAFARQMRDDAQARAAVADWERKLAPLAAAVAPDEPDNAIWRAIEQRMEPVQGVGNVAPLQRAVARWRFATVATGGLAASLAIYVAVKAPVGPDRPAPGAAVQTAQAPSARPNEARGGAAQQGGISTASASRQNKNNVVAANAERETPARAAAPETAPAYVAALAPASAPAALLVRVDPATNALIVRPLSLAVPAGAALRLWLLAPGAPPRPLGRVDSGVARLALPRDAALAGASIAATIEPEAAAADTPGGPFVYEGRLVRD